MIGWLLNLFRSLFGKKQLVRPGPPVWEPDDIPTVPAGPNINVPPPVVEVPLPNGLPDDEPPEGGEDEHPTAPPPPAPVPPAPQPIFDADLAPRLGAVPEPAVTPIGDPPAPACLAEVRWVTSRPAVPGSMLRTIQFVMYEPGGSPEQPLESFIGRVTGPEAPAKSHTFIVHHGPEWSGERLFSARFLEPALPWAPPSRIVFEYAGGTGRAMGVYSDTSTPPLPDPVPAPAGIDPRKLEAPTWVSAKHSAVRQPDGETWHLVDLELTPPHPDRSAVEFSEVEYGHPVAEAEAVVPTEGVDRSPSFDPPRRHVVRAIYPYTVSWIAHISAVGDPPFTARRDYRARRIEKDYPVNESIYGAWSTPRTLTFGS